MGRNHGDTNVQYIRVRVKVKFTGECIDQEIWSHMTFPIVTALLRVLPISPFLALCSRTQLHSIEPYL